MLLAKNPLLNSNSNLLVKLLISSLYIVIIAPTLFSLETVLFPATFIFDKDNDEGWVSKNLTMKARYVIVKNGTQILYKKDDLESNPIFRLEENVVAKLDKCKKNWCKVEF